MDTYLPSSEKNTQNGDHLNGNSNPSLCQHPTMSTNCRPVTFEMSTNEPIDTGCHLSNHPDVINGTDDSYDKDVSCGLCSIRCPSFLESKFANKKTFLIIFCITSILQGMYQTYFVSILTTIEKLYQIQSKTIGIVLSATEISQIIGSLFLTYFAGQGNRPKWIGIGILVFAISSLLTSTPHFIFDRKSNNDLLSQSMPLATQNSRDAFSPPSFGGNWSGSSEERVPDSRGSRKLCSLNNTSRIVTHSADSFSCQDDGSESRTQSEVTTTVLIIFFLSRFMIGIGATALNTLGISFLDDNVAPKESPLYFGRLIN